MKNAYKLLGIAVLAMAVVFSFAACDTGGGGGGGGGNSPTGNTSWPDDATLAKYYLTGFTNPAGLTFVKWSIESDGELRMYFTPDVHNDSGSVLATALITNGWSQQVNGATFTKNKSDGSQIVLWLHSASDIGGMYLGVK